MVASDELRKAFAEFTEDLLEVLQVVMDKAVEQKMQPIEAEHAAALQRLKEDRAKAEHESQLMWADISSAQAKLAQGEAKVAREARMLKTEKEAMTKGSSDDILQLNIGGERDTSILRSTLCAVEGSMLAATFSGRWDEQCPKDANGRYFVDYPASLFDPLLDYLREVKMAGPGEMPAWPPPVPEERLRLFEKMADYYGVAPAKSSVVRSPCRFAGTNNSCEIDGSPEAIRVTVDTPILLQGVQVLGARAQDNARYTGWLALRNGDTEVARQAVDYTVAVASGVAGELFFSRPVALEAGTCYDIILCVRGPESTCGESHGIRPTVEVDGVSITFANSPLDEAGTGFLEGVMPGIVFALP